MEKSLKYFLSLLTIVFFTACEKGKYDHLTEEEKRLLSRDIWHEELQKHGFNGFFQGTPKSQTLLDEIIALDPNNCDALREKSVPYLKRGIPHIWKPLFDKAVECDPVTWQPWRGYLHLYFYRNYDKAIADFNASDTLTPEFIDAPQGQSVNYWRGLAYLGKSDYQNSVNYFQTHIKAELKEADEKWIDPSTFLYLGIAQYELRELDKAEVNLKKMLMYNYEKSADANFYLAKLNLDKHNFKNAEGFITDALSNFNEGYHRYRDYTEEIRQIYPDQLLELQAEIKTVSEIKNSTSPPTHNPPEL